MQGYKGWKGRQRLHAKGRDTGWEWIEDCSLKGCLKEFKKYIISHKGLFLTSLIVVSLLIGESRAEIFDGRIEAPSSPFSFPHKDDYVTMDIVQTDGGGGTVVCPSVQACYTYVLRAEARGALQFCESMTIKRDGVIVWWRKYF